MHWLGKLMRGGARDRYEADVRHQQQERTREYAERQRQEIDERLERIAYLSAIAETIRQSHEANGDRDGTDQHPR